MLIIILHWLTLLIIQTNSQDFPRSQQAPLIFGGYEAIRGQFPYFASIYHLTLETHICGGSIINSRFIVTAANCVHDESRDEFVVIVGSVYQSNGTNYGIKETFLYGDDYDIGLIQVKSRFTFSKFVAPIAIARHYLKKRTLVVAAGFGHTENSGFEHPDRLRYVYLDAITNQECIERMPSIYKTLIHSFNICTYKGVGKGFCQGDSGGPIVANGRLIGVVSMYLPCAVGYPDIFVRVSVFHRWIDHIISTN